MATASAAPDELSGSGNGERVQGASRPCGTEQEESTPSAQRRGIVERATQDPGLLTSEEAQYLVRLLRTRVAGQSCFTKFATDFGVCAVSKQRCRAFAGALLTCTGEWFTRRSELLLRRLPPAGDHLDGAAGEELQFHLPKRGARRITVQGFRQLCRSYLILTEGRDSMEELLTFCKCSTSS